MKEQESHETQKPKFDLERKLRELIAEQFGISPDEVTMEFIRQKRAELYARPDYRFIFYCELGGYDDVGLKVRNFSEIEAEAEEAEAFWRQYEKELAKEA